MSGNAITLRGLPPILPRKRGREHGEIRREAVP